MPRPTQLLDLLQRDAPVSQYLIQYGNRGPILFLRNRRPILRIANSIRADIAEEGPTRMPRSAE